MQDSFLLGQTAFDFAQTVLTAMVPLQAAVGALQPLAPTAGPTASRPASPAAGAPYFDTDLGKPIWWGGTGWVDATGSPLAPQGGTS